MKIALVSQEYPPQKHGGIGTHVHMSAHGLAELGHEIYVIAHSVDNIPISYFENQVKVIRIKGFNTELIPHTESLIWLSYSFEVAKALKELHSTTPLDLIVFPEYGAEGYVHLLNQTPWNHIPSVVHIHGPLAMFTHTMSWPDINSELYRIGCQMESVSLKLADAVSASTRCSAAWCEKLYGIDSTNMPILYTGVDTSLFYPCEISKTDQPTIIFLGGVRKTKGVHLLVEAACNLIKKFPDLKVRILGSGEAAFIDSLRQIAIDAGAPELIEFAGQISREELPVHLSQAHFLVVPSFYEGGPGNVYLEAMACGIPAIGCSGSGVEGIVINMVNGLMITPGNIDELTHAMELLLEDGELRNKLGKYAREFILKEADSKVCIKNIESFYQSVCDQHSIKNNSIQNAAG